MSPEGLGCFVNSESSTFDYLGSNKYILPLRYARNNKRFGRNTCCQADWPRNFLNPRGCVYGLWVLDFLVSEVRHLWVIIDIVLGTEDSRVPLGHHILRNGWVQFALPLKLWHPVQDEAVDAFNVVHRRIGADGHDELSSEPRAPLDVIPVEVNYVVRARLTKSLILKLFPPGMGQNLKNNFVLHLRQDTHRKT